MADRYIYSKQIRNAPIRRQLDRRFVSWVMVAATVGAVLTSGFVYSVRCQAEAVALGVATQEKRAELEEVANQRRLLEIELERESSPAAIEQRARRIGLALPKLPERAPTAEPEAIVSERRR